jgi:F-type H+-transporting ATPase subunit epsilon
MADTFKLEIVTPYGLVLSGEAEELTAPGIMGQITILPGHHPLLTSLKIGEMSYKAKGKTEHLAVSWGFAEITFDKVTVLVESAEKSVDIDLTRAEAAKKRAEERLKSLTEDDADYFTAKSSYEKAMIRLDVAKKTKQH